MRTGTFAMKPQPGLRALESFSLRGHVFAQSLAPTDRASGGPCPPCGHDGRAQRQHQMRTGTYAMKPQPGLRALESFSLRGHVFAQSLAPGHFAKTYGQSSLVLASNGS